jgi:hypothetical protein
MQYKQYTVQTFERRIGEVASKRQMHRRKATLEGSSEDPQLRYWYRRNDTAARITDGACGHRRRCFLASTSGSQDAAGASSQKRKLVLDSIKEQHHQSPHQHGDHHSRSSEHQGFRRFVVTFNHSLHGGLPYKISASGDLGYRGDEGKLGATAPTGKHSRVLRVSWNGLRLVRRTHQLCDAQLSNFNLYNAI